MDSPEQAQASGQDGVLERIGSLLSADTPEEAPQEAFQQDAEAPQDEQGAEESAEALIDIDGESLPVSEVKNGYLRQGDYTRKTQEVAILQRNAHAVAKERALHDQAAQATRTEEMRLAQIEDELGRYRKADLTSLSTEDLLRARTYIDQKVAEADDLKRTLEQKRGEFQKQADGYRQQAVAQAYEYVSRHVKGWTPGSDTEKQLSQYVASTGIDPSVFGEVALNLPPIAVAMWKAAQYDQLQAARGKTQQALQKAPPMVKPGAVKSTNAALAKQATDARLNLKKTGDVKDLATLLLKRGI